PEIMDKALSLNLIDQKIDLWPSGVHNSEIIFLATPLSIIKQHLNDLSDFIGSDVIVTDLGSTKLELSNYCKIIDFKGIYIGGHPMTGAEKSGINAVNPLLYENAVYILTDDKVNRSDLIRKKLIPLLTAIKARILVLDPETHDRILAAISHLPQIIAVALINLVGAKNNENNPYFELAAGGFRDITRIASGSVDIWQDIFNSNKENVYKAIDEIKIILCDMQNHLGSLSSAMVSANDYRNQLPKKSKGFLSPLVDVLVYVNDQVGVVAKIANALSEKKIDIRDIELLKIREKEGGVFRLSFGSGTEARDAVAILNAIGYRALIRE
ncbi:MAG TPA: prephenate dehydrogenase/arogenate dehydrogenase family protein, partial [Caldithrix sp.]|nr:prephenate dehydrogenase/arogenate dehydrogenase family protein [Caldithrix sp.]